MELQAWLGEDPEAVLQRSHYERVRARMDRLVGVAVVCLPLGAFGALILVAEDVLPAGMGRDRTLILTAGCAGLAVFAVGVAATVMANRALRHSREVYHAMVTHLAEQLGMACSQANPSDPHDTFAWSLRGEVDGREVAFRRGLMLGGESVCVLSAACPTEPPVTMFIGSDRERRLREGGACRPGQLPSGEHVWTGGNLDPAMVADLAIGEALVLEGIRQVEILADEGWVALSYTLGSPALDLHPTFVKRALASLLELADQVERRAAELPPEPMADDERDEP